MSADPGNDCRPSDAVKNLSVVLSDIIRSGRREGNNFIAKTCGTVHWHRSTRLNVAKRL